MSGASGRGGDLATKDTKDTKEVIVTSGVRGMTGAGGAAMASLVTAGSTATLGLLGLPLYAVTMDQAVDRVRDAVRARKRLFVSTPNLNFLVGSQRDAAFRRSVVDSDLSLADGMPLVWMARLLGAPLPGRVTGSGLFERLRETPPDGGPPVRVYFFGGPPGAAAAAADRLAGHPGGMVCVGHESPGFGDVASMSGDDVLARINASGADFLVVALGAAKGQAWIVHNLPRLTVPVVSHLGAVVNFAAGTVKRAPSWMQRSGLEWLWRIVEEPSLWRRYASDARALAGLAATRLLPLWVGAQLARWRRRAAPSLRVLPAPDGARHLVLSGDLGGRVPDAMRDALRQLAGTAGPVRLDLHGVTRIGPWMAGELMRLERAGKVEIAAGRPAVRRQLRWHGLDHLPGR